ncbi:upstream stimulatory factor isoform X2 [Ooceraea biroi]|uniref:upstream stimulatory factor isoform X2 n=1 Tax=Ooceraea biroi TaxID=2015173 RepID=UPI000F078FDF|nr:upstream stimulatory factor isoform X2 [Ooceraea biroi]
MEIVNRYNTVDESAEENIMSDETVGVVLEEAEIMDCDADVEADDDNIQYHLYTVNRGDNAVAYKVMHVNDNHGENSELSIATPLHNTVQVLTSPLNGQLYVLSNGSASDVATSESAKTVSSRVTKLQIKGSQSIVTGVKKRDERRRVTHNEIERRRRGKISNWISKLGKLLADCDQGVDKEGDAKTNCESQSTGGILARACEYITELREANEKLAQSMDESAELMEEAKNLRQLVEGAQRAFDDGCKKKKSWRIRNRRIDTNNAAFLIIEGSTFRMDYGGLIGEMNKSSIMENIPTSRKILMST